MIKVKIKKDKILITGHALYDEYGKDIVCAAVSSTVLCTINGIFAINEKALEVKVNDGMVEINICNHDDITDKLIQNMIMCLTELSSKYKKNIMIKEE